MASVRCEELESRIAQGAYPSSIVVGVINKIGAANTTTTPTGASQIAYGPAPYEMDVYVRNFGGQILAAKGVAPVVTPANGTLLNDKEYVPFHLLKGESIAVVTVTVA